MDAADSPAGSTLGERRPKGTPDEQIAAFGMGTAKAAEPEKPEPETPDKDLGAGAASPISNNAATLANRAQPSLGLDSAATPVSRPASSRNGSANAPPATEVNIAPPQPAPPGQETKLQSQDSSRKAQTPQQDDQRPQGAAPINAATMAIGALTGAFRGPETRSQPAFPEAPATPPAAAAQSLLSRFALRNIAETLRGPLHQTRAATESAPFSQGTTGSPAAGASAQSPTADAAATRGAVQDKLTTFTTERMQPRRDAEQVQGATRAASGALASLQALEQQETTGILTKIRDAAKANGGMEAVLSEMRPGGQFEDLRKAFNTVLSHDEGFAAAYDKATGAIANYAESRAALPPPSTARIDPNLARLQTLDHEIAEAAKALPGIKDGQSAFEDLAQSGREAVQKLFSAVQQVFRRDADLRGPSPSPGFGR
jgi:hypothetical protein